MTEDTVLMRNVMVLGGGVIGLSAAFRLAQAGHAVTVLERGVPGGEASHAAGGILGPQMECDRPGPFLDLCLRSRTLYPKFVEELQALSGLALDYRESGILRLAFDDDQAQSLAATEAWQRAVHLRAEFLDPQQVRELEPNCTEELVAGLWLPDDHQVDPRKLTQALLAACERLGVEVIRAEVQGVTSSDGRVTGVKTSLGELPADSVIVTLGAWSGQLFSLPVEPVRGQMLELRGPPGLLRHQLKSADAYVVSRSDGRVLVGSTMERVGFQKGTTEEHLNRLHQAALRLCPALSQATVSDRWSGLRPATPDHLPILSDGPLTGLVVATGHLRNGILLAPLTARLIVNMVSGAQAGVDLKPFRLSRFDSSTLTG